MIKDADKIIYHDLIQEAEVSKCNFKTVDYKTPPNIHILVCEVCGKESLAWSWNSLEDQK